MTGRAQGFEDFCAARTAEIAAVVHDLGVPEPVLGEAVAEVLARTGLTWTRDGAPSHPDLEAYAVLLDVKQQRLERWWRSARPAVDEAPAPVTDMDRVDPATRFARALSTHTRLSPHDIELLTGVHPAVARESPVLEPGAPGLVRRMGGLPSSAEVAAASARLRRGRRRRGLVAGSAAALATLVLAAIVVPDLTDDLGGPAPSASSDAQGPEPLEDPTLSVTRLANPAPVPWYLVNRLRLRDEAIFIERLAAATPLDGRSLVLSSSGVLSEIRDGEVSNLADVSSYAIGEFADLVAWTRLGADPRVEVLDPGTWEVLSQREVTADTRVVDVDERRVLLTDPVGTFEIPIGQNAVRRIDSWPAIAASGDLVVFADPGPAEDALRVSFGEDVSVRVRGTSARVSEAAISAAVWTDGGRSVRVVTATADLRVTVTPPSGRIIDVAYADASTIVVMAARDDRTIELSECPINRQSNGSVVGSDGRCRSLDVVARPATANPAFLGGRGGLLVTPGRE